MYYINLMDTNRISKWNVYEKDCPTRLVLDRIADKWKEVLEKLPVKMTSREEWVKMNEEIFLN